MRSLTETLAPNAASIDAAFRHGADRSDRARRRSARDEWNVIRVAYGLAPCAPALLTPPDANAKLAKGKVPAYGLTLQHYVTRLTTKLTINACPNAGHCTKVCVLDNGNGRYDKVQVARKARTEFLARFPHSFAFLIGWEIADAVSKFGRIMFRPNVNSDLAWQDILPSLTNGDTFGDKVLSYGYTKVPTVLTTDGWLGARYRVAYSWNETSKVADVLPFLRRGGSVAVVTDRRPKSPIKQWAPSDATGGTIDADLTDEWMMSSGTVGDLSAKGKARDLIGKSGFVVSLYFDGKFDAVTS
jgi:hypothetical protein